MRHDSPASSSRSKIVGTWATGDGRYGPVPSAFGTHDGTRMYFDPFHHWASRKLLQPHPGPRCEVCFDGLGLSPWKPSIVADPRTMCPLHEGVARNSNVRSEIVKFSASAARFGMHVSVPLGPQVPWITPNPERQAYPLLAPPGLFSA